MNKTLSFLPLTIRQNDDFGALGTHEPKDGKVGEQLGSVAISRC